MPVSILAILAASLQFVAAVLALRLIRVTGRLWAWIFIAAAILLMAVHRSVTAVELFQGRELEPSAVTTEVIALIISALMVMGLARVAPLFTSVRRSTEALQESERALATLMSNLPGMAYRCRNDKTWTMEFISDGCAEVTGYDSADLVGNSRLAYADLIHPDDQQQVWDDVQRSVSSREPFRLTYRIRTLDQTEKWVWEQGRGVFTPDGELRALEGFVTDITERKRLQEQLVQSQKMDAFGQLAGGVAHDFNNVLTAIFGYIDLIRMMSESSERVRDAAEQMERTTERGAALTRQLLTFSRRQVVRPTVIDLNQVLGDMENLLGRLIGDSITLETQPAPDLGHIRADAGQIEQVIMNLAVNARDAMADGGTLSVQTANVTLGEEYLADHLQGVPGPQVMLAVKDTGCGLPPALIDRIFEPFFTTKGKGQGTGLGLSTVFGIVKQARGQIDVQSAPGNGCTFRVYFPLVDEPLTPIADDDTPRHYHGRRSGVILLAEDDAEVRRMATEVLESQGYTVLAADNGPAALNIAAGYAGRIDLLLTDVIMPKTAAGELAELLARDNPAMSVLFMSGYTPEVVAHHGVLKEGVEYLEKPFAGTTLVRRVAEVLDRLPAVEA